MSGEFAFPSHQHKTSGVKVQNVLGGEWGAKGSNLLLRKQQMSLCRWEKGKEGVALARRENTEKQERKGGTTDVKHTKRIQAPNVGS